MKKIMVYKKDNILVIATMSELYSGAWAFDRKIFSVDISSSEIVEVCKKALNFSRSGLSEIDFDWKNINTALLKALKVKSMKMLYSECVCVSIEADLSLLKFIPSQNLVGGGFQHLIDQAVVVSVEVNNASFITSLMCAFSRCIKDR